jgi:hypothetical protein
MDKFLDQIIERLLARMAADTSPASQSSVASAPAEGGPFIGRYCVVRANAAGVYAGVVVAVSANADGTLNVTLTEARQLWRWWAKEGQGVLDVAATGMADRAEVKVGASSGAEPVQIAACVCIAATTPAAEASIRATPVRVRSI